MLFDLNHVVKLQDENDRIIRHPVNALAWIVFDYRYVDFSSKPTMLDLDSADMSTSYSKINVNELPSAWMCLR